MKKILFIYPKTDYFPEIRAYKRHLGNGKEFSFYDANNLEKYEINDYDIIWRMMGLDFSQVPGIIVHDYASLSVGFIPRVKNKIKAVFNIKPNLRLFLNENVRDGFSFEDNIDYALRDMGVEKEFFRAEPNKNYDFVYVGNMSASRKLNSLLEKFKHELKTNNILMIGHVPDDLYRVYKNVANIIFTGRVDYSEVPGLASKAIYGINFVPNIYPYNLQTSTKVLEYAAMNLKIVSTDYRWAREFEQKNKMKFFFLDPELNNLNVAKLSKHSFVTTDISHLCWERVLSEAGIVEKLRKACTAS